MTPLGPVASLPEMQAKRARGVTPGTEATQRSCCTLGADPSLSLGCAFPLDIKSAFPLDIKSASGLRVPGGASSARWLLAPSGPWA